MPYLEASNIILRILTFASTTLKSLSSINFPLYVNDAHLLRQMVDRSYNTAVMANEKKDAEKMEDEVTPRIVLEKLSLLFTRSQQDDFFSTEPIVAIKNILKERFTYSFLSSKNRHISYTAADIDPEQIPEFINYMRYHE